MCFRGCREKGEVRQQEGCVEILSAQRCISCCGEASRGMGRWEGRDPEISSVVARASPCLCGQSMRLTHGHFKFNKSRAEELPLWLREMNLTSIHEDTGLTPGLGSVG